MEMLNRETERAERSGRIREFMKSLARNMMCYICFVSPIIVIGVVWFDMTPALAWRTVYGGIPLIVVFVMTERAMMDIGRDAGKVDKEMLEARGYYRELRAKAITAGTSRMKEFVLLEIDEELVTAKQAACKKLKLDYDVYIAECADKSKKELKKKFGSRVRAAQVYAVNLIRPIVLTVDMIMSEAPTNRGRGGIGKTADEFLDEKKGIRGTAWAVLSVFLVTGFAIGPVRMFSWQIVAYTVWALMILFYRMARGYKNGVMAYASVQVRNYEDRTRYLEKYLEWMRVEEAGEKESF